MGAVFVWVNARTWCEAEARKVEENPDFEPNLPSLPWRDNQPYFGMRFSSPPCGTKRIAPISVLPLLAPWKGCWVGFKTGSIPQPTL